MILGSLICSMTSCSVRPKSVKLSPRNDSTIEATWLAGISTGPRLSEIRAAARITRTRTEEPTANRVVTPDRDGSHAEWRVQRPSTKRHLRRLSAWRCCSFCPGVLPDDRGTLSNCGEWSPPVQAGLLARGWISSVGPFPSEFRQWAPAPNPAYSGATGGGFSPPSLFSLDGHPNGQWLYVRAAAHDRVLPADCQADDWPTGC